jgi:asparagine synthase (glutamine-hydrolysing)
MSGIAGWMATPRHTPEDRAMAAVLDALAHRGPDGAGACGFQGARYRVVLGQRRFALGESGGDGGPRCDEAAEIAIALDGEIDNADALLRAYRSRDTEVVSRLSGAFAFALWDARKERLLLARDRFGEKPLYYCESAGSVFFASELRALLKIPGIRPEVDVHAVRDYLAWRYVPGPRTLFKGIQKLAPGTYTLWQLGRRRDVRYWTAPDREPRPTGEARPADAVEGFLERLEDAVTAHLASGAAAGALLCGSLDSSVLLALMSRQHGKVRTFTAGFAGEHSQMRAHAAKVAQHFGAEHHEVLLAPAELPAKLGELVAHRGAPLSEPADLPLYFLAHEAARSVKVALTPEGSDELLGGRRSHVMERLGWPLAAGDWRSRCVRALGGLDPAQCDRLAAPALNGASVLDAKPPFDAAAGTSRLRRVLYFEQASRLPDHRLEVSDRMTMAASLEARAPFLDHRLAHYVSALPDELRVRGLRGKWILREAARSLLPKALRTPPGADASMPARDWLGRELLLEHLSGASSLTRPYYNAPVLDRMLDEHLQGRRSHQQLLWMLLNLEIWHRSHRHA